MHAISQSHKKVPIKARALELKGSVTLADIVAYKGSVRYEKESPTVYWIMGRLHTKNEV